MLGLLFCPEDGDNSFFKTLVAIYHTTQHHITEDINLHEINMVVSARKKRCIKT
jgi:hypothetical protein